MTPSSASSATRGLSDDLTLDQIMQAAVDVAPEAIRRRVVLQAIDWSRISSLDVATMIAELDRRQQPLSRALVDALLLAGHTLPTRSTRTAGQRVLNDLNGTNSKIEALVAASVPPRIVEAGAVESEIGQAIVARLSHLDACEEACVLALALWRNAPQALSPIRSRLKAYLAALPTFRASLTGFSTTDMLAADLAPAFGRHGRKALITQTAFGNALAMLLQPDAAAEAHIVLLDCDGFAEFDWRIPSAKLRDAQIERADLLSNALSAYAARTSAPLLINSIPVPSAPTAGLLDNRHFTGSRHAVQAINERLLRAAEKHSNILVVDADHALVDVPPSRHRDQKLWFYGRLAYSADATRALACAFADVWALARRGPAKVLALDFDNTLWGGVYGDDGLARLACGQEFPGNAFRAFQQECLRLKRQGLLLVALSKNDPEAISVFDLHPGMALKSTDFAASAINWRPKPENIRDLARELNLGLDSFVFIDDSPHEREAMRRLVPEVIVPELPEDPAQRPNWLRRQICTWPVRLTKEDERRTELYGAERGARALKASAATVEDYLCGLQQRLTVSLAAPDAIVRVAQMHQRTNQFNLTSRRLTEADLAAHLAHPTRALVIIGRVIDKFGDHGLVTAATVSIEHAHAEIETFLMSCRVIGRGIEQAFLAALLTILADRGIDHVVGKYFPTEKNAMVREFYPASGFAPIAPHENAATWSFNMKEQNLPKSQFVSVTLEV